MTDRWKEYDTEATHGYVFFCDDHAVYNPKIFRTVTTDMHILKDMDERGFDFIANIGGALHFKKRKMDE